MLIFWRLVLAHFIADFTFQTNWVAHIKRHRLWGMGLHAFMHMLVNLALTRPWLGQTWARIGGLGLNGWTCVFLLFILHFLQDEWRVFTIKSYKTSDGTLHFAWDQLVHYGFIFALSPFWAVKGGSFWVPETWVLLGVLGVGVTHFTTVLIYFLEKDFWGKHFPQTDEKYFTMGERLMVALSFVLPGFWCLPPAAIWLGLSYYFRKSGFLQYSWFGYGLGSALAAALGLAARTILA